MRALLVIDMLKDFVYEDGALVVPGSMDLVAPINEKVREFRDNGEPVIFVCDAHGPDDKEFKVWPPHAIDGTQGCQVIDEIRRHPHDTLVKKTRYSAFFDTDLQGILQGMGVRELVLTGVLTDICVMHTAVDADMRDFKVIVPRDCVKSVSQEAHEWALRHMQDILLNVEIV